MRQKLLNHLQKAATQYKLSTTYGELLKAQHVLLMFYISQKQESVPCLYGAVKPAVAEVAKGRNRLEKLLQMILKCYYFPWLNAFVQPVVNKQFVSGCIAGLAMCRKNNLARSCKVSKHCTVQNATQQTLKSPSYVKHMLLVFYISQKHVQHSIMDLGFYYCPHRDHDSWAVYTRDSQSCTDVVAAVSISSGVPSL